MMIKFNSWPKYLFIDLNHIRIIYAHKNTKATKDIEYVVTVGLDDNNYFDETHDSEESTINRVNEIVAIKNKNQINLNKEESEALGFLNSIIG